MSSNPAITVANNTVSTYENFTESDVFLIRGKDMYTIYAFGVLERIKIALAVLESIEEVEGMNRLKIPMKVGKWDKEEVVRDGYSQLLHCSNGAKFKITVEEVY